MSLLYAYFSFARMNKCYFLFEFKSRAFHFIRNISIITGKMYKVEVMDKI